MNKPIWKKFITDENDPEFAKGINERHDVELFTQTILWRDAVTKEIFSDSWHQINRENGLEFLVTKRHPYHEEIQLWAITQQPVYYRYKQSDLESHNGVCYTDSLTYYPFANPDIFEYSFTPFTSLM